jgi:sugar lactone lactonase YvrE
MNRLRRLLPCAALATASLWAGGSTAWESNTFADFIKGRFQGISLTRDGRLTLAPSLDTLASTGEAGIWSVISAPDGTIYFSTGHRGRVYQVRAGGQPTVVWASQQPEVFALALDSQGRLYAGTSPDGRIYRIEGGKATEFFNPSSKYIWSLAVGPDGAVYAATGDQGQVWRVTPDGKGSVWYETGQTHVTALAIDPNGRILAGTEPNGILFRIEAKDKAFVLYDSSLPEIRSIVLAPDGSIYVAALGGALAQKQAQAAAAAATSQQPQGVVTSTITVTSDAQAGVDIKPKPEAAKPPAATGAETPPTPAPVDVAGVEKAALYRIAPDNMVETVWSSKEENVFDLVLKDGDPVFSTDQRGRIYRLSQDLKATLLLETHESETTRLLPTAQGIVAATSNQAKLYRLSNQPTSKGIYESPVHDAGNVARWGRLDWRIENSSGKTSFRTRAGNSARPDRTWSEWSEPVTDLAKALVSSPNARYIQWQAEFQPVNGQSPLLDSVSVSYQPQNGRPVVRSVQVTPQWVASAQKTAAAAPQTPISYSITVTDSGDSGTATSSGTPTQNISRSGTPQLFIAWQADDPDGDKLIYSLWYRAEDEQTWKLLKSEISDNTYMQETEVFADGRYYFRVLASDRLANSPASAREGELVSQPVLVDQTPPTVTMGTPRVNGNQIEIDVDASDAHSPVRRGEFSFDGSAWKLMDAADGIADSKQERFIVRFNAISGEHSVVVRVFDSAGNPGLARLVLR